ncbi:ROK family transcriptional regulator [Limnochorda pilosa]|uniref:HTH marR-type domain-containing protein n=1 Tax=Limnochorda pilosa TaxID=1555112 RepID=A0A0K2SGW4_LIMPI|nr:ROK family transcriptional regulator [Limnochorda pilosa]BAS26267.1 hypothetical protein LIP_0410 [Limnochorda pilosa]
MRRSSLTSTSFIRSYNAASILRTMHEEGACTRTSLARTTKMSPATVSRIIGQLMGHGIVREESRIPSSAGRKPVLLRIDYAKLPIVGVELRRNPATILLSNLRGERLERRSCQLGTLESEGLISELAGCIDRLIRDSGLERAQVLGVGLAVSGVVDHEGGRVVRSLDLDWHDVPVAAVLGRKLGLPALVENDANAAALAELQFGRYSETTSFMYLKTETSVGAGIVLQGELLNGPGGMAGEIAHVPVIRGGHPCPCGQRGCLQTYLNVPDVLARYRSLTGEAVERETFFERALGGDPTARRLVDEAAEALAVASSFAGALLDVNLVVVGGVWGTFSPSFLQRVEERFQAVGDRTGLNKKVAVRGSSLGDDSDLMGAIGLVSDRWLNPYGSVPVAGRAGERRGMLLGARGRPLASARQDDLYLSRGETE